VESENLFQVFSEIFIESQQSFNKSEAELRNKCRVLAQKLNLVVEDMEKDVFNAKISKVFDFEEEVASITKTAKDLVARRQLIKDSVGQLKRSTEKHMTREI
tara:strand:- start:22 stop:327 length:306 start_codon:yes stop_codon:yes gene_type:complete